MIGQIIKVKKSFCEVKLDKEIKSCVVRGNVKKMRPVVGDLVEIDKDGAISLILPRNSYFIRPSCANVDIVNVVVASVPKPDFLVVDRLIAMAINGGAGVIITVNKSDISSDVADYVLANYQNAVDKIFVVSAEKNTGLQELKNYLQGKLVVFAGQSAVGKTSIINGIFGENFRVGEVSKKTQRGKNTTTSSTIVESDNVRLMDTPGFTSLYALNIKQEDLKNCYREFYGKQCYFVDCLHNLEPDCGVKLSVENKEISQDRYNRYLTILKEIKEQKYE
ncbi:MAG: ribosome small subunit-dependent GTPase A [Clostridia bacterium]|nr:ribosome small subunit-dependent GTPase A [Clostridia bacterium]